MKARVLPLLSSSIRPLTGSRVSRPPIVRFGIAGKACFVGGYHVQPGSSDSDAILTYVTGASLREVKSDDKVSLGYCRRDGGYFVNLATTTLWCWQLGARLRWWTSEGRALAFDAIVGGVPTFCVVRQGAEPVRLCERSLFDVRADARMGIALTFCRRAWARPGYGYPALEDPSADEALPQRDGVTLVDMQSGLAELVCPMSDFARLLIDGDRDAVHQIDAASFSPKGTRFSVLCKRIPSQGDIHNWQVEAIIGEADGSGIRRVPLLGRASPYRRPDVRRRDLHPRWSRDGRPGVISSPYKGPRAIYDVDLAA